MDMLLRCCGSDSVTIQGGETSSSFFQDVEAHDVNAASNLSEAELVDWVVSNAQTRRLLLECLGLKESSKCVVRATYPFITGGGSKPGDIDFIACDEDAPHEAVAIEFKRIKVVATGIGDNVYRVLKAVEKVESQIEGLHGLGFSRTFLGIIVVIDGRLRSHHNFTARGPTQKTFSRILDIADGLQKPEGAGVLYIEISQPISKPLGEASMVCMCEHIEAVPRTQHGDLSDRVKNVLSAV